MKIIFEICIYMYYMYIYTQTENIQSKRRTMIAFIFCTFSFFLRSILYLFERWDDFQLYIYIHGTWKHVVVYLCKMQKGEGGREIIMKEGGSDEKPIETQKSRCKIGKLMFNIYIYYMYTLTEGGARATKKTNVEHRNEYMNPLLSSLLWWW